MILNLPYKEAEAKHAANEVYLFLKSEILTEKTTKTFFFT